MAKIGIDSPGGMADNLFRRHSLGRCPEERIAGVFRVSIEGTVDQRWVSATLEGNLMIGFYRALGCCAGLALLACSMPGSNAFGDDKKPAAKKPAAKEVHDHEHATQGPHKGALIELGEEEYHGEIVLDEKTHLVTVYVLGSNAKDAVAIESTEVVINLKHGDKPEQFKLKAAPQTTDPKGKSSRFSLKDEELIEDLHHAQAQLRVKITGKSFIGKITLGDHDHDHADHDHPKKKKS